MKTTQTKINDDGGVSALRVAHQQNRATLPNKAQHSPLPDFSFEKSEHDSRTSQIWAQIAGERQGTIETLQGERDHYKAHADKLAEALREVKVKLGEHEGKGDPRAGEIIIEAYYKATEALAAYEAAQ